MSKKGLERLLNPRLLADAGEAEVEAAPGQQRVVGAPLDHPVPVQDHDSVEALAHGLLGLGDPNATTGAPSAC